MDFEVDIKKQKRRERIGLVVFVLAILGIFIAVTSYMFVSHSLDLAASDIDSNVGQLDGYLTITFEGDNTPRPVTQNVTDNILKQATDFFNVESEKNNEQNQQKTETNSNVNIETANLYNVRDYYREKGSTVCKIKCSDYTAYTEGEVFERGYWKLGVLSVTPEILDEALASKTPTKNMKALQEIIYKLRYEDEVDLVCVIAPNSKITKYLDKVDFAICKVVEDDIPDSGKVVNDMFVMRVPNTGLIGAILSSPAKMLQGHVYSKVEVNKDED